MLPASLAQATVVFLDAGVNNSDFSVASSGDTTSKNRVLAGITYTSAGFDCPGTDSCNSCDARRGTGIFPCNRKGVGGATLLTLHGKSDNATELAKNKVFLREGGSSGNAVTVDGFNVDSSGEFTLRTTWAEICNLVGSGSGCQNSAVKTLQFGVGDADEKVDIEFVVSAVDSTNVIEYTDCEGGSGALANDGYCSVHIKRGDKKVYAKDLFLAGSSVSTGTGGVKWKGIAFFPVEATVGAGLSALGTLTNAVEPKTISYDNSSSPPTLDERVTGLDNGTNYCFIMANIDETGNIYKSTPFSGMSGAVVEANLCATPDQVIGLLDDKKCFIATAAFGSPFEAHVRTLRDFRDRFLKTSSIGRAFVDFYYEWSPPLAKWIAHRDGMRAAVRVGLAPAVGFAELSLRYGMIPTLFAFVLLAGLAMGAALAWRRRRTR